jgi:hypothetical protein
VAAQCISAGSELLFDSPPEDEDSRFRCLLALGTLAAAPGTLGKESKGLAGDLGLGDVAAGLVAGRGSNSCTFQLNGGAFCGTGVRLGGVEWVFCGRSGGVIGYYLVIRAYFVSETA